MAHEKKEDAAAEKVEDAAADKVEDEENKTIVLSDDEMESFTTVEEKMEKKKRFCTMSDLVIQMHMNSRGCGFVWNCRFCNRKYHYLRDRGSLPSPATRTDQRQRYIECPGDWRPDT